MPSIVFNHTFEGSTADVAAAFGFYPGKRTLLADVPNRPDAAEIVLITGESGAGKSSVLRNWCPGEEAFSPPATPLLEWRGVRAPDAESAFKILVRCGLGEASLFTLPYAKLSDSQQCRARLARAVIDGAKRVVQDEFLSTLDRETAKATAQAVGALLRTYRIGGVFVTAHSDVTAYLGPDMHFVFDNWPSRFTTPPVVRQTVDVSYRLETAGFYTECPLRVLHYLSGTPGGTKVCVSAHVGTRCVGILALGASPKKGRNRITRVVVHPSYRGLGVAASLVGHALNASDTNEVDAVAAMGHFSNFFVAGGMKRISSVKHEILPIALLRQADASVDDKWRYGRAACVASPAVVEILATNAKKFLHFLKPGGRRVSVDEAATKIRNETFTADRLLWTCRPHVLDSFLFSK